MNHLFWSGQFNAIFVPQVRALVMALHARVLPTFTSIDAEADQKIEEEYERLTSAPASDSVDLADLSEKAFEKGLDHYLLMSALRQGLQNMFAATLYHLFEQQVMLFHRREVLAIGEENDASLFKHAVFQNRLLKRGINVKEFSSWPRIEELRLVANTVKHAEGASAVDLHRLRPDLFVPPSGVGLPFVNSRWTPRVYQPLFGEDLYVSAYDVEEYGRGVEAFWSELSEAMADL